MTSQLTKVFVYGTLQPGEVNYEPFCADHTLASQRAIAHGQLFALPLGYPAMTVGESIVHGHVLSFADSAILQVLDKLEQVSVEELAEIALEVPAGNYIYDRQQILTLNPQHQPLGLAWVYLMNSTQVTDLQGVLLPSGQWSSSTS